MRRKEAVHLPVRDSDVTNEVWLRLEDDTTQLAPVSLLLDELSQLVFVMRETVVAVEVIFPLEASVLTQSTVLTVRECSLNWKMSPSTLLYSGPNRLSFPVSSLVVRAGQ